MTHLQHALTQPPLLNPISLLPAQDASALNSTPPPLAATPANDAPPDELDNPAALKKAFAERCNWETLTTKLRTVIEIAADNLARLRSDVLAIEGVHADPKNSRVEAAGRRHIRKTGAVEKVAQDHFVLTVRTELTDG